MADPIFTPMIIGAGLGAATSSDPLKGAVLGGITGGAGGALTGAAGAYGALPGLSAGGQQAGMLAAQTGAFGPAGLSATGAAAASAPKFAGTMMPGMFDAANKMAMMDPLKSMGQFQRMGGLANTMGAQQVQPMPMSPAPQIQQRQAQPTQRQMPQMGGFRPMGPYFG